MNVDEVLTLQVAKRTTEAEGIVGFLLTDPLGKPLPSWEPGSHIDIHIDRPGQPGLIRQYSLCGDPGDLSHYRVAVLRDEHGVGGSVHLHDSLRQGVLVRVSSPRTTFSFAVHPKMVFIAGGIGITPILPMIAAADAAGSDWELHYAGRALSTMAFTELLEVHADRVQFYPSNTGERMPITHVVLQAQGAPIYACGPTRLLDALEEVVPSGQLHIERFVNDNELNLETDRPFDVELSLSGLTLTVNPGESILDKVVQAGIPAPSSCRGGTCGTCETFVLAGNPDHRDAVLNAQEREESEVMMICVSRCNGDHLVLEL